MESMILIMMLRGTKLVLQIGRCEKGHTSFLQIDPPLDQDQDHQWRRKEQSCSNDDRKSALIAASPLSSRVKLCAQRPVVGLLGAAAVCPPWMLMTKFSLVAKFGL